MIWAPAAPMDAPMGFVFWTSRAACLSESDGFVGPSSCSTAWATGCLFLIAAGPTLVFGIMDTMRPRPRLALRLAPASPRVRGGGAFARGGGRGRVTVAIAAVAGVGSSSAGCINGDHPCPCARHLRHHPHRRRRGEGDLGRGRCSPRPRRRWRAGRALLGGPALSVPPPAADRRRAGGGARAPPAGQTRPASACWCAPAPRTGRWRSITGVRVGGCSPSCSRSVMALAALAGVDGTISAGADRHGRDDPESGAGGDRHRRYRLGARRLLLAALLNPGIGHRRAPSLPPALRARCCRRGRSRPRPALAGIARYVLDGGGADG